MIHPELHPARRCITCAHHDEDGCLNGFPADVLSCTEHQTETESEFFMHGASRAPLSTTLYAAGVQ